MPYTCRDFSFDTFEQFSFHIMWNFWFGYLSFFSVTVIRKYQKIANDDSLSLAGSPSTAASPTVSNGRAVAFNQRSGHEAPANTVESLTVQGSHAVGADLALKVVESSLSSGGEIVQNGKRKSKSIPASDMGKFISAVFLC